VARAAHHGASLVSLGALLGGTGACLVVLGVLLNPGGTWVETRPTPSGRLSAGGEVVGSALIAAGALSLLAGSSLDAGVIVAVIGGASVLTYGVMTYRLREHLGVAGTPRSWWWCLRHPLWRPAVRHNGH
jgi:hypothetical protein